MITVGLVLAAGNSTRFGADNKLLAPFRGRALATFAAEAMNGVPLDRRLVVTSSARVAALFPGFDNLHIGGDGSGQSDSLRLGVARAMEVQADRLIIALADMPLIDSDALKQVLSRGGPDASAAVGDGTRRTPPACFPAAVFPHLLALCGDRGAGDLLKALPDERIVRVPPATLRDVDTMDDLRELGAG